MGRHRNVCSVCEGHSQHAANCGKLRIMQSQENRLVQAKQVQKLHQQTLVQLRTDLALYELIECSGHEYEQETKRLKQEITQAEGEITRLDRAIHECEVQAMRVQVKAYNMAHGH